MQTVMFNIYYDVRPNTYFTNITSQITMPWNRPWCSYELEIFREYAQIGFPLSGFHRRYIVEIIIIINSPGLRT